MFLGIGFHDGAPIVADGAVVEFFVRALDDGAALADAIVQRALIVGRAVGLDEVADAVVAMVGREAVFERSFLLDAAEGRLRLSFVLRAEHFLDEREVLRLAVHFLHVAVDRHGLAEIGGRRERRFRVFELGQVGDGLVDVLPEIFALPVDVDAALDGADEGAELVHHGTLMAAVDHVEAVLDALEIRVLAGEDGVVLLVAVGVERLAEFLNIPPVLVVFRVVEKARNVLFDGFHVAGERIDFGPVVVREEENRAFILRRRDGIQNLDVPRRRSHEAVLDGGRRLLLDGQPLTSGVADLHTIRRRE